MRYNLEIQKLKTHSPMPNKHWFYGYPKFLDFHDGKGPNIITHSKLKPSDANPRTLINIEQAIPYIFIVKIK